MNRMLAFGVLVLCCLSVSCKKLPSYITPCSRNGDISACYRKAVDAIKPYLPKGIPELGIPPCDPLVIPKLQLEQPQGASVGFNANLTNLTFYGGLDFELKDIVADYKNNFFSMELYFPRLRMISDYSANGRVLIVNFNGGGKAHGDFGDVTLYGKWYTEKVTKKGKQHYKIARDETDVDVKKINVEFENLFNGNQQITDNTNRLINENTELLFGEIKPIVAKTISQLVSGVINFVNNRYNLDELYPNV